MPIPPVSSMSYHATKNYSDGSNHPGAVNNAPEGAKLIDAENRELIAKTVYANNVFYHAT